MPDSEQLRTETPQSMHFLVLGPDGPGPSLADLRRLFRGQRLTAARRNHLAEGGRILALCGPKVVGLAAYERTDRDVRVGDVGLDPDSPCGIDGVANGLLDALELACMASGARRLVLLPRVELPVPLLQHRGFTMIADGGAGTWFEKRFV
ncbi:MAG: hypothetical protein NTY02_12140 [Acidobacteria bacterium]|nr:hypothetical protein [Acidobacteriota bacterium]